MHFFIFYFTYWKWLLLYITTSRCSDSWPLFPPRLCPQMPVRSHVLDTNTFKMSLVYVGNKGSNSHLIESARAPAKNMQFYYRKPFQRWPWSLARNLTETAEDELKRHIPQSRNVIGRFPGITKNDVEEVRLKIHVNLIESEMISGCSVIIVIVYRWSVYMASSQYYRD